jgi:hypothetical protein
MSGKDKWLPIKKITSLEYGHCQDLFNCGNLPNGFKKIFFTSIHIINKWKGK